MGNASQCSVKYDEISYFMADFIYSLVIALSMVQYLCGAMLTFSAQLDYNMFNPLHMLLKGFIIRIFLFYSDRYEFKGESEYEISLSTSNTELLEILNAFSGELTA